MAERKVLCGASSYEKKYYFNEEFKALPEDIQTELHIMCVMYTEEVSGIITMEFSEEGNLEFKTSSTENDFYFDEIGSALVIKKYQREKKELLESLELYYKVFFLGEKIDTEN